MFTFRYLKARFQIVKSSACLCTGLENKGINEDKNPPPPKHMTILAMCFLTIVFLCVFNLVETIWWHLLHVVSIQTVIAGRVKRWRVSQGFWVLHWAPPTHPPPDTWGERAGLVQRHPPKSCLQISPALHPWFSGWGRLLLSQPPTQKSYADVEVDIILFGVSPETLI